MVNFGERLLASRAAGWERYYIDYAALKKMIETGATISEADSAAFLERLAKDVEKMDAFVEQQRARLDEAFRTKSMSSGMLSKDMAALRRFVGTNIIAATKIVKKHDKHVDASLQKRKEVASLIRSSRGINALPALQTTIDGKVDPPSPKTVAIELKAAPTGVDDDDDESEAKLRALPNWLLADDTSSTAGPGKGANYYVTIQKTYLDDWRIDEASADEDAPMLASSGEGAASQKDEKWDVDFSSNTRKWSQLSANEKALAISVVLAKLSLIVISLYAFICSLSFLASGFRLVAGRQAGEIFRDSELFNNPIAGMLVGVLVTVLVQSSSTSTSIIITMVAADLLTVRQAISLIMGANIGTSVTSTIVALAQSVDRNEFRRAFAAATVHDMFNFLSVLVLLPLEAATGYLYSVSLALINATPGLASGEKPPDMLKALTKPFTKTILSIDKKVVTKIALANTTESFAALEDARLLKHFFGWTPEDLSDGAAGAMVLIGALLVLCVTLYLIVWMLKSLLKGRVAVWLHRSVNGDVPDLKIGGCTIPLRWLSGYLAMVAGLLITICVQSSSITTSALTPLVGVGVITVDRMYPTVLGANIGTCITGVLAALAADSAKLYLTLQVAYSHLLFNFSGIFIFYVFFPLRPLPILAAKFLGNTTAKYRWFAIAYLFACFFTIPLIFMGLSLASAAACVTVAVLVAAVLIFVFVVNALQARRPSVLPSRLRTWEWLPAGLRSLEPFDRLICGPLTLLCGRLSCCRKCLDQGEATSTTSAGKTGSQSQESQMHRDIEVAAERLELKA